MLTANEALDIFLQDSIAEQSSDAPQGFTEASFQLLRLHVWQCSTLLAHAQSPIEYCVNQERSAACGPSPFQTSTCE